MSDYIISQVNNLNQHIGKKVELRGWLYNKRHSGKLFFLQIRDGSGIVQAVIFKKDVEEAVFELAAKIGQESSLIIKGEVREDKRSPIGVEIGVESIEAIQVVEDYPISPKEHGVAFLMDHRHLWLRSKRQQALMWIRHKTIRAIHDYFDKNGYLQIDSPIFTSNSCEGTSTLFETEYFGRKAYLSQSGQLYQEAAALAFGKTYCFGPTFRAEKSKTRRHLTEFWMLEPEVAFCDLNQIIDITEDFVCYVMGRVLEDCKEQLKILERDTSLLEKVIPPFPRLTYNEAVDKLKELGLNPDPNGDFGAEDETELTKLYDKPIFVTHFPASVKAFYMKKDPSNPELAACMDMLAPEGYGEVIGGGQREDDLAELERMIAHHKLNEADFKWFLDLRRYGTVPHAGFGLGLERFITWICGLHHLRETIPFPRLMERLEP